jgi:hypothetical protein
MLEDLTERFTVSKPSKSYPRRLSEFLKPCLGEVFAQQGFASAEIVTRWPEIVGEEIAAHAEPMKLQWPRGDVQEPEPATLVLRAEGPAAVEIQHLSEVILERVNRFFGWRAVKRIAIRQAPLLHRRAAAASPPLGPDEIADAEKRLPAMNDQGLRHALSRLGAAIKHG